MYRPLFWFLLPLVVTELIFESGIQVVNGGIARMPRATETLAAYGIAWGITSFLIGTVSQTRQMSMVLVQDPATFRTVIRCVLGFGGIHLLILGGLAFTPFGIWAIDLLHNIEPTLGSVVRTGLGYLLPLPMIVGITRFMSGLLLRVRRTDVISYAMMAGISMSVLSVIVMLTNPAIAGQPILLPVISTYCGSLTELGVMIYGYRRFARGSLRRKKSVRGCDTTARSNYPNNPSSLTTAYVLRFYWPLAVTIGIQGLSRPIINLFVARGSDGAEALAVLTIVYALAHLPYGWLNELKNLPPAFQKQDPDAHDIRRFTACCGLLSLLIMALMFWTPARFFLLESLLGLEHEFAVKCTTPLFIFSFFPLAVTIRSYLHGLALRDHRTSAIAPSGPSRAAAIVLVVNLLSHFDLHGAVRGVAALYSGFVAETLVVRWRMKRR